MESALHICLKAKKNKHSNLTNKKLFLLYTPSEVTLEIASLSSNTVSLRVVSLWDICLPLLLPLISFIWFSVLFLLWSYKKEHNSNLEAELYFNQDIYFTP